VLQEAWKVLACNRWSVFMPRTEGGLHYPVGVWVRPAEGMPPLMVFAREGTARAFTSTYAPWRVVRCEIRPTPEHRAPKKVLALGGFVYIGTRVRRWWAGAKAGKGAGLYSPLEIVPLRDTLFADAVRCLE